MFKQKFGCFSAFLVAKAQDDSDGGGGTDDASEEGGGDTGGGKIGQRRTDKGRTYQYH